MPALSVIGGLLGKIFDRALPDRSGAGQAQARVNEAEVSGAGPSVLRLWRGFLGWVLALVFVWEVAARPIILTYRPETTLPPSMLKEALVLLSGMLGLL